MPSNEHIDDVNLMEFTNRKFKRPDGNTPLNLTKEEIRARRLDNSGRIKFYGPGQVPEQNPTTIRKRVCPVCNYSNGRLMATCYRCRICFACGSHCGDAKDDKCPVCANFNTAPPPEKPTINL